jgi:hypothetical protein
MSAARIAPRINWTTFRSDAATSREMCESTDPTPGR